MSSDQWSQALWRLRMRRFRNLLHISVVATLFAVAGAPALATTAYQGADYSYSSANDNPVICDQEADSRTAYVKGNVTQGSSFRVEDQDGSSGSCWYEDLTFSVAKHKTCEDINNWPDDCTDLWHYE